MDEICFSDALRQLMPNADAPGRTARELIDLATVDIGMDRCVALLYKMHRSGELLRSAERPYRYNLNPAWRPSKNDPRRGEHLPAGVAPAPLGAHLAKPLSAAAILAAAQPAVAQNTGSPRPAPTFPPVERAVAEKASAAVGAAAEASDLRCALWSDGRLTIEAPGQRVQLSATQTRALFSYLERVSA